MADVKTDIYVFNLNCGASLKTDSCKAEFTESVKNAEKALVSADALMI